MKVFDRYIRKTLDVEQHRADYAPWRGELDQFRKKHPEYPSFEELYGRTVKKRKRPNGSLQYEVEEMENVMEFDEKECDDVEMEEIVEEDNEDENISE